MKVSPAVLSYYANLIDNVQIIAQDWTIYEQERLA